MDSGPPSQDTQDPETPPAPNRAQIPPLLQLPMLLIPISQLYSLPPPGPNSPHQGSNSPLNSQQMATSMPAGRERPGRGRDRSRNRTSSPGRVCKFCKQHFAGKASGHLKHCGGAMQCRNCGDFCAKGGIKRHLAGKCRAHRR